MLNRLSVALFLFAAVACGGSSTTTTPTTVATPSPIPTPTAPTLSLTGQVVDSATSTGIANARVSIGDGPNHGRSAATDGAGNYSLPGLQPSGFTLNVAANNYVSQSIGVTLTSNQTLSFRLNPPRAPDFVLTGQVTDRATAAPIAGAVVSINGRYRTTTDGSGHYSDAGFLDAGGNHDFTYVSANNYASDYRYIRATTQNVRLYRIERITAGDSTVVTVAPDDTLCVNNVQDTPGLGQDYVCRSLHVVASVDGIMTLDAVSTQGGVRPRLEVETIDGSRCCSERLENPTSLKVTAGMVVVVNVEMIVGSTISQSFTLTTSMTRN